MMLIKESPQLFSAPSSLDGLIAVLKREPSAIYKAKSNPSVYILAAKLLVVALKDSFDWPESVAKVQIILHECLLLPIPNLRGNHPIACSGKPNPSKRQSHLHVHM